MLQERTHRRHVARSRGMKLGSTGKVRHLTSNESDMTKIHVGKTTKQRRPNRKIRLRKEWLT